MLATRGNPWTPGPAFVEPDAYLTNGRELFRVVRGFSEAAGEIFALLEDCRSLEVRSFTTGELREMGLQSVTPPAP